MPYRMLPLFCVLATMLAMPAGAAESIDPAKLPGIVIDDASAENSGAWRASTITKPYVAAGYRVADVGKSLTLHYRFELPAAGEHHVLAAYSALANRAPNATYIVASAEGEQKFVVNQQVSPVGPCGFHDLGKFKFAAGANSVTLSSDGAKGFVIADAVILLTPEQFARMHSMAPESLVAKTEPRPKPNPTPIPKPKPKPDDKPKADEPPPEISPPFAREASARDLKKLSVADLDELLARELAGVETAAMVSDEQFLRRATLDIIGRQPTLDELTSYLAETGEGRRQNAVERLLASSEFGRNWSNYWVDVIRFRVPDPELTFLNYQPLKEWLAERFNAGGKWDEITYALLTATGKVEQNPAATYLSFHQGARERIAGETTRIFLSVQIACAECHDHPFYNMPQTTFHGVAAYFARLKVNMPQNSSVGAEIRSEAKGEHKLPGKGGEVKPVVFSAAALELGLADTQRRAALARWIVHSENPYFARAYANRMWSRFMGRGFCEPIDEIGEPASPELPVVFAAVAEHFAATQYDVKDMVRLLTSTQAYQRSLGSGPESRPFAAAVAARLRGDEVFDSLVAAVDLPNVTPPQAKPSPGVRFPPPPKSTRDLVNDVFGIDPSLPIEAQPRSMPQAMFLMNNSQIQGQVAAAVDGKTRLAKLLAEEKNDPAAIQRLYQQVLARQPSTSEIDIASRHIEKLNDRPAAFEDLLWSLLNSAEFTTRR